MSLAATSEVVGWAPPYHVRRLVADLYCLNVENVTLSLGGEGFSMHCAGLSLCTDISRLPEPGEVFGHVHIEVARPLLSEFLISLGLLAEGMGSGQRRG